MMKRIIKVGYLVSYDWKLLEYSIPQVYDEADIIVLALDINRKTWAGNLFEFDESAFRQFIGRIDSKKKIELYEDNFFDPTLTTMQNEVRERNLLAQRMGAGGWHIQIDADEYPIDFSSFVQQLKTLDPNPSPGKIKRPVNVQGQYITTIKKVDEGYIFVKPDPKKPELFPLATQVPKYEYGRRNGYFNFATNLLVVHESRSRSNEEFYFKLKNWGHNNDFHTESYFALWKAIDGHNYRFIKNFNPIGKDGWPELALAPVHSIPDLIKYIQKNFPQKPGWYYYFKNSRNLARIRGLMNKIFKD